MNQLCEWKLSSGSVNLPQNPIFQSEWDKPLYEARLLQKLKEQDCYQYPQKTLPIGFMLSQLLLSVYI